MKMYKCDVCYEISDLSYPFEGEFGKDKGPDSPSLKYFWHPHGDATSDLCMGCWYSLLAEIDRWVEERRDL